MGCTGSKEEEDGGGRKGDKSGGGTSGGASGGAAAAGPSAAAGASTVNSDPRIPMTAKQKYSIVASWKGIHRALEPTGVSMFVKSHIRVLKLIRNCVFHELLLRNGALN
ncbi:unnamed protein product [Allacma fusca]|uniref:Uncharacterized protein n=1 Tax=Allacma fusca TaxID=39272 RepID=A0A8J2PFA1_9HEXA|nr:unnamed protein product [Allacma fusca]